MTQDDRSIFDIYDEMRHKLAELESAPKELFRLNRYPIRKDFIMRKHKEIIHALYKSLEILGADSDLLAAVGSYGDSLTDEDVLDHIIAWNEGSQKHDPK